MDYAQLRTIQLQLEELLDESEEVLREIKCSSHPETLKYAKLIATHARTPFPQDVLIKQSRLAIPQSTVAVPVAKPVTVEMPQQHVINFNVASSTTAAQPAAELLDLDF